ncbi:MAG: DUF4962 domain-containing protein, partial [Muribaculaceae bacterium]|nr:DUF4962 domain-containing protein [Muribaculaceae bacterium]
SWCFYNHHDALDTGRWYWRFRTIDSAGTAGGWSDTYDFEVTGNEPVFTPPAFECFHSNAPKIHPRLYAFTNGTIDDARSRLESLPDYRNLISRAATAMKTDVDNAADIYSNADNLRNTVDWLYQAFLMTADTRYADKLLQLLRTMLATPPNDSQLYSDNFTTSAIVYIHAAIYDILYTRLSESERAGTEIFLGNAIDRFYRSSIRHEENHIFDNHFWQHNMRNFFQAALTIYDKPSQQHKVLPLMEYLYELWIARAPAGGFNRDGNWINGTGYFNANVRTLSYMPLMLSYVTRFDFTQHPWYRNAGRALSYTTPPTGDNIGFGDGSENRKTPNHQIAAFAHFLARTTGCGYADWYASMTEPSRYNDWELRIWRMCLSGDAPEPTPASDGTLTWYKDSGEVAMHSDLFNASSDLALGFRSSTFGSGSHTTASQNAFNLNFGGKSVFRSSGYYQNFSDAHNLMSYRHSRAHNTILVNGIGQPYSTKGWGRILRAAGGSDIAYALGDASHAYCGTSDDPMWIKNFAVAGISQSPENGFGVTPLSRYYRHIAMLGSEIVVIYDELEASENADWQWLLHSASEFDIAAAEGVFGTTDPDGGFKSKVSLFCSSEPLITQTSEWRVAPAKQGPEYPKQWHLTAEVRSQRKVRYLAIIQVGSPRTDFDAISRDGNNITVGRWNISAELSPDSNASLRISDSRNRCALDYGRGDIELNGVTYRRQYLGSTMLVDYIDGRTQCAELTDHMPASSRSN